jgi:hypothetical protein
MNISIAAAVVAAAYPIVRATAPPIVGGPLPRGTGVNGERLDQREDARHQVPAAGPEVPAATRHLTLETHVGQNRIDEPLHGGRTDE